MAFGRGHVGRKISIAYPELPSDLWAVSAEAAKASTKAWAGAYCELGGVQEALIVGRVAVGNIVSRHKMAVRLPNVGRTITEAATANSGALPANKV